MKDICQIYKPILLGVLFGSLLLCCNKDLWSATSYPDMKKTLGYDELLQEESLLEHNSFPLFLPEKQLTDIEALQSTSSEGSLAAARLEESLSILEYMESSNSGPRIVGHATLGHYRELSGADNTRNYSRIVAGGGLRYPLLGSLGERKTAIFNTEANVREKRLSSQIVEAESVQTLRSHYINYWSASEQLLVSRAFLKKEEDVRKILNSRNKTGHLRDGDKAEFLAAFDAARRNISIAKNVIHRSIRGIRLLTRKNLPLFHPQYPELPLQYKSLANVWAAILDGHPRLALLRERIEQKLILLKMNRNQTIKGDLGLDTYLAREEGFSESEYGVNVNMRLEMPFHWHKSKNLAHAKDLAALKTAQSELDSASTELLNYGQNLFDHINIHDEQCIFTRQRLKSALETLREAVLRNENLPGDTFEKLEQSRYNYYQVAMDYIEALRKMMQTRNDLLALTPQQNILPPTLVSDLKNIENYNPDSLIDPEYAKPIWSLKKDSLKYVVSLAQRNKFEKSISNVRTSKNMYFGFYVWNSRKLLHDERSKEHFYNELKQDGVYRLLVSFDSEQIAQLKTDKKYVNQWHAFISRAVEQGISVELLLGEPTWILPGHRQKLLQIVQQLHDMPFAGLHLDLEPNQLDEKQYGISYLLSQLLRTVEAVTEISPWPVGISLHPRYLNEEKQGICLGCALKNMGIYEVALMSYVSNPERLSEIIQPVITDYPRLNFVIAQSVEPVLPSEESYFNRGKQQFFSAMDRLAVILSRQKYRDILIQSYSDYQLMQTEKQQ